MEVGLKLVFDKESNVEDVIGKISGAFGKNDGLQSISEIACKESKIDSLAQLARRAHNAELDLWTYRAVAASLNDAKRLLRVLIFRFGTDSDATKEGKDEKEKAYGNRGCG